MLRTIVMSLLLSAASLNALAADADPRDLQTEEANRALVIEFYDQFFNQHQVEQAGRVVAEHYKQHNPEVPDGKAPFVGFFAEFFDQHPESQARIVRSAADGDLVYLHVHSTSGPADLGQAVVDIFRVHNGMIVEHWDVIQDLPANAANDNSMF
ncbi:nuclear transport factor 2 family protein [Stutzerimonas zhaodongensis]|uniref:nuclear transport factor 2 family protein n=1 Tax=Stutzerimonas zhaodongensis TaxID=1176257 RepID=UPI00210802D1|nr:ester cyclase [Stutzerimonas zhaodongensis]MCQ2028954.1 ester cyclase [Stutzerimonas zhaodongensis]